MNYTCHISKKKSSFVFDWSTINGIALSLAYQIPHTIFFRHQSILIVLFNSKWMTAICEFNGNAETKNRNKHFEEEKQINKSNLYLGLLICTLYVSTTIIIIKKMKRAQTISFEWLWRWTLTFFSFFFYIVRLIVAEKTKKKLQCDCVQKNTLENCIKIRLETCFFVVVNFRVCVSSTVWWTD